MKTALFAALTMLVGIAGVTASAQPAISPKPGKIMRVEGKVYLDSQPLQPAMGEVPSITENSLIRTKDGHADVQLAAGLTLRLAENASFRTITNRPAILGSKCSLDRSSL
ncbi:MAG: hypothetical protein DMG57_40470 [Acidobacteria bacterium]|nr:MAG: hypothetical protein DMG57_40470 [Acidobacteriota bacterium]